MDIKKGKVLKDRDWSLKTQKNLASMLGITAALSISGAALTACSGDVSAPSDEDLSSSSEVILDGMGPIDDRGQDISSSSVSSSSSGKMSSSMEPTSGISSSGVAPRPLSSSSEILLSGIPLQESSSSAVEPPLSAGILPPQIEESSSSSYKIDTLAVTSGEVYIEPESGSNIDTGHLESSSSVAEPPSSNSEEPLPGDPIEIAPVEPPPMLSGVIEDTPVRMDEPKQ